MATWEYKLIVQRPVPPKKAYFEPPTQFNWDPEVDLDEISKEGCELVSVASIGYGSEGRTSELRYYFKRERGTPS